MLAEAEVAEYLDEIRKDVCSHCVERPPGGPPCAALGKQCGVEMHLPKLIESIHQVHSEWIEPYLEHNRQQICENCAFLHSALCPCPMDYLAVLVVSAVEAVDKRRHERADRNPLLAALPDEGQGGIDGIRQAYQEGTGTWTGCDWPTSFGKTGLDLNGCTAAAAEALAAAAIGTEAAADWSAAAHWLTQVELHARRAETQAAAAVAAAVAGRWPDAQFHAGWAWALEFATGRPLRHGQPLAWQRLRLVVEITVLAHPPQDNGSTCSPATIPLA